MAFGIDDFLYIQAAYMVSRVASSIYKNAYDFFTGKKEKEERKKRIQLQEKFDLEYKMKQVDYQQRLKIAEKQFVDNINEWNRKKFYDNCWPLRNPFEMPIGYNLEYSDDRTTVSSCTFKLLSFYNNNNEEKRIIPCRVISALKNNVHPYAQTINANLSSFILNNYPANGINATISEVGAWRDDIPANDASINYLYSGLKGQPVMVLMPEFINDGTTIVFKVFSWGLGEDLPYPCGFEFGRLNMKPLFLQSVYETTLEMMSMCKRMGYDYQKVYSSELIHNIRIITDLKKKHISGAYENNLLEYLKYAPELKPKIEEVMRQKVSGVFCAIAGLYADTYHLLEYGTRPHLPELIEGLPGTEYMAVPLVKYYRELYYAITAIEADNKQTAKFNKSMIINSFLSVIHSLSVKIVNFDDKDKYIKPILSDINKLLSENKSSMGADFDLLVKEVASITRSIKRS